MKNRLDNTNCPELDPIINVMAVENLEDDLRSCSAMRFDADLVLWREGEVYPVGSVHVEDGLAFMLLNPVY